MKKNRIRILVSLSVIVFLLVPVSNQGAAQYGSIQWLGYDEGLSMGKKEGKKIFMFFWADWCKYCEQMQRETFTQPQVIKFLNEYFISIKVNSDVEKVLATRYFVRGLPTLWFLGRAGEKIGYHPGYVSSEVFLPYLRYIQSDKYKTMSFQEFLKIS